MNKRIFAALLAVSLCGASVSMVAAGYKRRRSPSPLWLAWVKCVDESMDQGVDCLEDRLRDLHRLARERECTLGQKFQGSWNRCVRDLQRKAILFRHDDDFTKVCKVLAVIGLTGVTSGCALYTGHGLVKSAFGASKTT